MSNIYKTSPYLNPALASVFDVHASQSYELVPGLTITHPSSVNEYNVMLTLGQCIIHKQSYPKYTSRINDYLWRIGRHLVKNGQLHMFRAALGQADDMGLRSSGLSLSTGFTRLPLESQLQELFTYKTAHPEKVGDVNAYLWRICDQFTMSDHTFSLFRKCYQYNGNDFGAIGAFQMEKLQALTDLSGVKSSR